MKWEVKDLKYGEIEYEEFFWTKGRKITINGMELTKERGRTYTCPYGDEEIKVKLRGNILTGVKIKIEDDEVVLVKMSKWYELLLALLMPVLLVLLGMFTPILSGGLQGALTGLACAIGMVAFVILVKKMNNVPLKILVWLLIFACVFVASFTFAIETVNV